MLMSRNHVVFESPFSLFWRIIMQPYRFVSSAFLAIGFLAATLTPASASVIIDDFESYSTGNFPSPDWTYSVGDGSSLTDIPGQSITVQDNANNIDGKHLQFVTTYQSDSVTRVLPLAMTQDGDYLHVECEAGALQILRDPSLPARRG